MATPGDSDPNSRGHSRDDAHVPGLGAPRGYWSADLLSRAVAVGIDRDTFQAAIDAGLDPEVLIGMAAARRDLSDSPVLPRDPEQLPAELARGAELSPDLDPFADGILMLHQKEWLEDRSDLKLGEKGRRTGITFAEALDDTLIAAASRSAGGDNVFYIGDTKDKGREFIGYVAHFARVVAKELGGIEEFLFEDKREDGTSRYISGYRVQFASGYRVEALSSRPENIRGLQGVVVIDEAAFHENVREVLDAVNALLIWGGKIRVISTHNGKLNPFNELINEAKAGQVPFSLHFIPFQKAVDNGLYERMCLLNSLAPSPEGKLAWEQKIRGSYGVRVAKMRQELDAIPADAEGSALSQVVIESVTDRAVPVIRWTLDSDFAELSPEARKAVTDRFLIEQVKPVLDRLDGDRRHDLGWDFARSGDTSGPIVTELGQDLVRRQKLVLELRNVPFETQRDVAFYILRRLPRLGHAAFDATGNGAYLAEVCAIGYSAATGFVSGFGARVSQVKLSQEWYRQNAVPYVNAFGEKTIVIAADADVVLDHQALQYVGGIIKVPDDFRFKGSDGFPRHGDTAIGGMLAWYASRQNAVAYGYQAVPAHGDVDESPFADHDAPMSGAAWWRPPLGARIRPGGI
jgi:phage FluMu gp28-like protein